MLPKTIFVTEEKDRDETYLNAVKTLKEITPEDGQKIGVYELKETKTVKVSIGY